MKDYPWIWSTWVKTPYIREEHKEWLIASACLPIVAPHIFEGLSKDRAILLACPEREPPTHYGKIASMIRSCQPEKIVVATIEGSPHCFTLHASVNEAEYILGERVNRDHYVILDGKELKRIDTRAVRVARYLHLVDRLLKENPTVLEELASYSLEHKKASTCWKPRIIEERQ